MVPESESPAGSSNPASHLPGGLVKPLTPGEARPWWYWLVPIKPNAQGRPNTDDVADWIEATIPFM